MRYAFLRSVLCLAALVGAAHSSANAADWLTLPSTYTHDAQGMRVSQYATPAAAYAPQVSNFRSSGYTHTRSSLQFGPSADHYHRVEQWGDPVRPYGEWRFPYRPYSQPYQAWGAPLAGLGPIGGYVPYPYGAANPYGTANPYGAANPYSNGDPYGSGNPYPPVPGGGYAVPPYYDGNYPSLPYRPRLNDEQFFKDPRE